MCPDAAHEWSWQEVGELHFWYHGCREALCNVSIMEHTNTQYRMMQSKQVLSRLSFSSYTVTHLGTEPGEGLFVHEGRGLLELFALLSKCLVKV